MPDTTWNAWCFSHGALHTFIPRGEAEHPDGAWCTADWVRLNGGTQEEALADKQERFGDARFIDHLSLEQQVALIQEGNRRRD